MASDQVKTCGFYAGTDTANICGGEVADWVLVYSLGMNPTNGLPRCMQHVNQFCAGPPPTNPAYRADVTNDEWTSFNFMPVWPI